MKDTHYVNPSGAENTRLKSFAPSKYKRLKTQQLQHATMPF